MAVYLKLYNNWYQKSLVNGLTDPGSYTMPARTYGEILPLRIYMVAPNPGGISFSQENIAGTALEVVVASAPGGTVLAANYSFSQDLTDGNGFFYGNLDFSSTAINTWLAGELTKNAYCEFRWTGSATPVPFRTTSLAINQRTVPVTQTTPVPGQTSLSKEVGDQLYVSKKMGNGETIMIPSQNGEWATIIGTNNDGSVRMESVQLT